MGKIASTIKSRNEDCARRRPEGGCQVARPHPGAARPWPAPGWRLGPPGNPRLRLFAHIFSVLGKTLDTREKIHEKFRSHHHRRSKIRGTEVSVPAPCRS